MKNSFMQIKTIQYVLIATSLIALMAKNAIDTKYIEHQNEILRIVGYSTLALVSYLRYKYEEGNIQKSKITLVLTGILGGIAIGEVLLVFYPVLKSIISNL